LARIQGRGAVMTDTRRGTAREPGGREAAPPTRRQKVEALIDDMGAQSFPASDPPAWGVVASRLEQAERDEPGS
jgi:hypothetical protein